MLLRDLALYRVVLHELTLCDLVKLYERALSDQPVLAQAISEELDGRLVRNAVVER